MLSRRRLLQLAATSGVAIACSTPTANSRGSAGSPSEAPAKPRRGGVLVKYTITESETLDPTKESSATNFMQLAQLYSGLVRFDPSDGVTIVPDLARSWETSKDGRTYTFVLRDDVKFHDGSPMVASDVVFSLLRAKGDLGLQVKSPKAGTDLAAIVEKISVTGTNTVEVRTKAPSRTLLPLMASPLVSVVPEKTLRAKSGMFFTNDPIGTGPFKLKQWVRGQVFEFERFNDYVTSYRQDEELPYLDGVRTLVIPNPTASFTALLGGQIDLTPRSPSLSVKQGELLKQQRGENIVVSRIPDLSVLVAEISTVREPFKSNAKLRQAIRQVIDRKRIADQIYEGLITPGYLVDPAVFPDMTLSKDEIAAIDCYSSSCDDKAKALIAQAGLPAGLSVEVSVDQGKAEGLAVAEMLAQNLRGIGLNASVSVKSGAAWSGRRAAGDFDILVGVQPAARFPSPLETLFPFTTAAGTNFGHWTDLELDGLLKKADQTLDAGEFRRTILEAQRRVASEAAGGIVPIGVGQGVFAASSRVKGFRFNPTMYESWRLDTAWLEG